jgi:hypothetical protein
LFSEESLSLDEHVYENNTGAVRLLSSLSVLQFTIIFETQHKLCTLEFATSINGLDLYAFSSLIVNARNTEGSYLSNKILTKVYSKYYFQTKAAAITMIIV